MSVGVLIISHDGIGAALFGTATFMVKHNPLRVKLLAANRESEPEELYETAILLIRELNDGDGVLVLTDLFGSTPSNIAQRLQEHENINIVSGLNLSMLIRLFNYADLNLIEMAEKAYSGGIEGIIKRP